MDEEIDRIPLAGVDFVKPHTENAAMEVSNHEGASQDLFCFQVATSIEGYNSGRTYTMRTRSKALYDDVLPLLTKLAQTAQRRAQANSLFRRCQRKVREIYNHSICQSLIALVITGVSARSAARPPSENLPAPRVPGRLSLSAASAAPRCPQRLCPPSLPPPPSHLPCESPPPRSPPIHYYMMINHD